MDQMNNNLASSTWISWMQSFLDVWWNTKQKMEKLLTDSLKELFNKMKIKAV
jgi:hypothetical protein